MSAQKLDFDIEQVSLFWDVLSFFYKARNGILNKYQKYKQEGTVGFAGFDELIEYLNKAKTGSHELFRSEDAKQSSNDPRSLFDFVVSTIYHESLHIKEHVYILHAYASVQHTHVKQCDDSLGRWVGKYTEEIFTHSRAELPESFNNVSSLFDSCETVLSHLLPFFSHTNLGRIAYCSRTSTIREMFGSNGIIKFYNMMYKAGAAEGFVSVGCVLIKRGFYLEGAKALKHMLRKPDEQTAKCVVSKAVEAICVVTHSKMPTRTKSKLLSELNRFVQKYK